MSNGIKSYNGSTTNLENNDAQNTSEPSPEKAGGGNAENKKPEVADQISIYGGLTVGSDPWDNIPSANSYQGAWQDIIVKPGFKVGVGNELKVGHFRLNLGAFVNWSELRQDLKINNPTSQSLHVGGRLEIGASTQSAKSRKIDLSVRAFVEESAPISQDSIQLNPGYYGFFERTRSSVGLQLSVGNELFRGYIDSAFQFFTYDDQSTKSKGHPILGEEQTTQLQTGAGFIFTFPQVRGQKIETPETDNDGISDADSVNLEPVKIEFIGVPFLIYKDIDGDSFGAGESITIYTTETHPDVPQNNEELKAILTDLGIEGTYSLKDGDCAPEDAAIHPKATEIAGDGIDQDCDGQDLIDDADTDGDGLKNFEEAELGTDKNNPDTDGDGLLDGTEVKGVAQPIPEALQGMRDAELKEAIAESVNTYPSDATVVYKLSNPLLADTDGDGLTDPDEVEGIINPKNHDTDGDGLSDSVEKAVGTDPLDPDSDHDWIGDGVEGTINQNALDALPKNYTTYDGTLILTDTDGDETSDVFDLDSDNDEILDAGEGTTTPSTIAYAFSGIQFDDNTQTPSFRTVAKLKKIADAFNTILNTQYANTQYLEKAFLPITINTLDYVNPNDENKVETTITTAQTSGQPLKGYIIGGASDVTNNTTKHHNKELAATRALMAYMEWYKHVKSTNPQVWPSVKVIYDFATTNADSRGVFFRPEIDTQISTKDQRNDLLQLVNENLLAAFSADEKHDNPTYTDNINSFIQNFKNKFEYSIQRERNFNLLISVLSAVEEIGQNHRVVTDLKARFNEIMNGATPYQSSTSSEKIQHRQVKINEQQVTFIIPSLAGKNPQDYSIYGSWNNINSSNDNPTIHSISIAGEVVIKMPRSKNKFERGITYGFVIIENEADDSAQITAPQNGQSSIKEPIILVVEAVQNPKEYTPPTSSSQNSEETKTKNINIPQGGLDMRSAVDAEHSGAISPLVNQGLQIAELRVAIPKSETPDATYTNTLNDLFHGENCKSKIVSYLVGQAKINTNNDGTSVYQNAQNKNVDFSSAIINLNLAFNGDGAISSIDGEIIAVDQNNSQQVFFIQNLTAVDFQKILQDVSINLPSLPNNWNTDQIVTVRFKNINW